jgi:hypothetical protein
MEGGNEKLDQPFCAFLTIREIDTEAQTFVAQYSKDHSGYLDTMTFNFSDMAEGVEPRVGLSCRSDGAVGDLQIRLATDEDFIRVYPPKSEAEQAELDEALEDLRGMAKLRAEWPG